MIKTDIFDRVYLVKPIVQAVFDLYLESTCREITAWYGEKYTLGTGEIPLMDAYENALVQGILYRHTALSEYENAYRAATEQAYRSVWRTLEKQRRKEG